MGGFFKSIGHAVGGALGLTKDTSGSDAAQAAYNLYDNQGKPVSAPNLQQLALQSLGPSAFASLNPDQTSSQAQDLALGQLSGMASESGLTPSEQARLRQIQDAAKINEQGQRGAIDQSSRARGLINSGSSLASKLIGTQGAYNGANSMGTDLASQAGTRQMNAANALGSLGTTIGGQRFAMGAEKANAADAIAAYNNNLANQANIYNTTQLPQQDFTNRMAIAGNQQNALFKKGAYQGAENADQAGNLMNSIRGGLTGFMMSDKRLKKDIKPASPELGKFLDKISASSYKYKDPDNDGDIHVGPMAQELEKHPFGKSMVVDTPEGKMVHGAKAALASLSAAKMLHDRIKKLEKK